MGLLRSRPDPVGERPVRHLPPGDYMPRGRPGRKSQSESMPCAYRIRPDDNGPSNAVLRISRMLAMTFLV